MRVKHVLCILGVALVVTAYSIVQLLSAATNEMIRLEATHLAQETCLGEAKEPIESNWYRIDPDLFMETYQGVDCVKFRKWYSDKVNGAKGKATLPANKY